MATYTKDQKTVFSLYAFVLTGSILLVIPYSLIPIAGLACVLVGLPSAYLYRRTFKDKPPARQAMTDLIGTIWWAQLILTVAIGLFVSVLAANGDFTAIDTLMADAEKGIVPTETDMRAMQLSFVQDNLSLITWTALLTLPVYPVFLVVRLVGGIRRFLKSSSS